MPLFRGWLRPELFAKKENDKSLAMSKWEHRLFLVSCLFWVSVALLIIAGVIMYVFFD